MCTWGKKSLKFLVPLLFVVVLFVTIPLSNSFAEAQGLDGPPAGPGVGTPCTASDGTPGTYMYVTGNAPVCVATGTNITERSATTKPEPAPSYSFWDLIEDPRKLMVLLAYAVLELFSLFLTLAAAILDFSIELSIVNMTAFLSTDGGLGSGLLAGWGIIRDLVNIVFVFVLLFVGINTILGSWSSSSFNTKLIPKILLAALLINFSMLFTKIIIDTSNILTLELYTAAQEYDKSTTILGVTTDQGLSGAIMGGIGIQSLFNGKLTNEGGAVDFVATTMSMQVGVWLALIVVLIAMFVFLVMAFMLLGRMVVFIILIMTSPIAFIGELLPQLKSQTDKWWQALWGQAFFAPIFFAMILVIVTIINDPNFQNFNLGSKAASVGIINTFIGGGIEVIIKYFIVIYLLVAALIIAKSVSSSAGKGAAALGSKLAGGAMFGTGAFAGRQILGRTGSALTQTRFAKEWSDSDSFGKRIIGRSIISTGAWSGKQSFDARSLKATGALDAGKAGGRGGYEQWMKDQEKAKKKQSALYGGPSESARAELDAKQRTELEAKRDVTSAESAVRRAKNDQERMAAEEELVGAEEALAKAIRERGDAEKIVKRETAESQISNARREQQTFGTAKGLGNKASALWTTIVNPSDREAARKFEEDAIKERNKNTTSTQSANIETALKKIEERAREWEIWDEKANDGKGGVKEVANLPGSSVDARRHRLLQRQQNILKDRLSKAEEQKTKDDELKKVEEAVKKLKENEPATEAKPEAESKPEAK